MCSHQGKVQETNESNALIRYFPSTDTFQPHESLIHLKETSIHKRSFVTDNRNDSLIDVDSCTMTHHQNSSTFNTAKH